MIKKTPTRDRHLHCIMGHSVSLVGIIHCNRNSACLIRAVPLISFLVPEPNYSDIEKMSNQTSP